MILILPNKNLLILFALLSSLAMGIAQDCPLSKEQLAAIPSETSGAALKAACSKPLDCILCKCSIDTQAKLDLSPALTTANVSADQAAAVAELCSAGYIQALVDKAALAPETVTALNACPANIDCGSTVNPDDGNDESQDTDGDDANDGSDIPANDADISTNSTTGDDLADGIEGDSLLNGTDIFDDIRDDIMGRINDTTAKAAACPFKAQDIQLEELTSLKTACDANRIANTHFCLSCGCAILDLRKTFQKTRLAGLTEPQMIALLNGSCRVQVAAAALNRGLLTMQSVTKFTDQCAVAMSALLTKANRDEQCTNITLAVAASQGNRSTGIWSSAVDRDNARSSAAAVVMHGGLLALTAFIALVLQCVVDRLL